MAVNDMVTFIRPREDGRGFAVQFSPIDRDTETGADARMHDRSRRSEYFYQAGRFTNVLGTQTIRLREWLPRRARVYGDRSVSRVQLDRTERPSGIGLRLALAFKSTRCGRGRSV